MKRNLFFLILILVVQLAFSQQSNTYYKIKINYSDQADLQELANSGICLDHGFHKKNHFFI